MVNQIIVDYLKQNAGKYNLSSLKEKIISSGYSETDLQEAIKILGLVDDSLVKPIDKPIPDSTNSNLSNNNNNISSGKTNWMNLAGIFGVSLIILNLLFIGLLYFFNRVGDNLKISFEVGIFSIFLIILIFSLFFIYGFTRMGRATGSKLLIFSSRVIIVLIILILISVISLGVLRLFSPDNFIHFNESINRESSSSWFLVSAGLISFFVLFIVLNLFLFFIGLFKVGKHVKFAKISGVIGIVFILNSIVFLIWRFWLVLFNPLSIILNFAVYSKSIFYFGIFFEVFLLILFLLKSLALFNCSRNFEVS